jgi:stage II sporulation protein M
VQLRNELWFAGGLLLMGFIAGTATGARMVSSAPVSSMSTGAEEIPAPPRLFLQIAARNTTVFVLLLTGVCTAGVTTSLMLALNGALLGMLVDTALSAGRDAFVLATLLVPHGVIEMTAFAVAGAVGLRGWRIALRALQTGDPGLRQELAILERPVVFGLVALVVAAGIESTVTRWFLLGALGLG